MLFLISGAVILFLMLGIISLTTATPPTSATLPTSPNQPIFTLTQIVGGPAGYTPDCDGNYINGTQNCTKRPTTSLSWSFSKSQGWRETTYCLGCLEGGLSIDFSGMNFRYENCTPVIFKNSSCFPKENQIGIGNPLERCLNPPNGNYTIYGYLNRTSPSAKNTTFSGFENCYNIPADPSKSEVLWLINNTEDGDPCAQGALRGYQAGKILAKYNISINFTTLLCNVNVNGNGGIYN
jgi:hypothetical protein